MVPLHLNISLIYYYQLVWAIAPHTYFFTISITEIMRGRGTNAIYTARGGTGNDSGTAACGGRGGTLQFTQQGKGRENGSGVCGERGAARYIQQGKGRGTVAEQRQRFKLDHLNY